MHYFFKFILSIVCLFGLFSCTYDNGVLIDGSTYFIINYTDEYGHPKSEHAVDYENIDKDTIRVFIFGSNPDEFDSYIIKAPFEIIEVF